jgi:hypothetical protein
MCWIQEAILNAIELKLYYHPKDRLRLTIDDDRSYPTVKPVWAAPLSQPGKNLALMDAKGNEIALISDPNELSEDSRAAVKEELKRRYLTATVTSIAHAKVEFGATYWSVETDRGPRDFVTQSLQENAIWLGPSHLLLLDVDGNGFEILDVQTLNEKSRAYIAAIL